MGNPSKIDHVTKSALGQLCDGPVCTHCNKCASCGRVLDGSPHDARCQCDDNTLHYVCCLSH